VETDTNDAFKDNAIVLKLAAKPFTDTVVA